jgi:formamidopyrimidine-DNA glycosylase
MPELPEVETVKRSISNIVQQPIVGADVYRERLRWPVPPLGELLSDSVFLEIRRRGKYLLCSTPKGTLIVHLGMTGKLYLTAQDTPLEKHDHCEIHFANGQSLRYNDYRRFGCLLWTDVDPLLHPLIRVLGIEPLEKAFNAAWLFRLAQQHSKPIKALLMDAHLIVGIGNIYANEILFAAGIRPDVNSKTLSMVQCQALVTESKRILQLALAKGGSSVKDFVNGQNQAGSFQEVLQVYTRAGQPCFICSSTLVGTRQGQRSTVYCAECQR